jgi:soluble lytic murein transglycosylase-like protein
MRQLLLLIVFLSASQAVAEPSYKPPDLRVILNSYNSKALKYDIPPLLFRSLCGVESEDRPEVEGDDGMSLGLCQIKLESARLVGFTGTRNQLKQVDINTEYSARYLSRICHDTFGNWVQAITCYNGGPGFVSPHMTRILQYSKSSYTVKVYYRWQYAEMSKIVKNSKVEVAHR